LAITVQTLVVPTSIAAKVPRLLISLLLAN
jgi:hypothetical protein